MTKWNEEDWREYEEYLENLTCQELENELKFLESLGKAKKEGKNIVVNDSLYEM